MKNMVKAISFFLNSIINQVPEKLRTRYKSQLIKKLKEHKFIKRKNNDPAHPNSMELQSKREITFINPLNPKETANTLITSLQGFYVSDTQERIRKYIINNV